MDEYMEILYDEYNDNCDDISRAIVDVGVCFIRVRIYDLTLI